MVTGTANAGVGASVRTPEPGPAASGAAWLPPTPADWPLVVGTTAGHPWQVTRGVQVHAQTLDSVGGRQGAQVMSVDLSDPNVRVGVVEAGDTLVDPADETVTSMADRTGAVAGVNAGFFDIHATGQPTGGVVVDGRVLKSPQNHHDADLVVRADGSMAVGPEQFSGTVSDGSATHPLASVNWTNDALAGSVTEITPDFGGPVTLAKPSTLVLGTADSTGTAITVTSITSTKSLPALAKGTLGLLAAGTGGSWLTSSVHAGDVVHLASSISPDSDLRQLVTGATQLVKDGQVYTDPTGTPPGGTNPETAVGVSKDGRHAFLVTLDGRLGESVAQGVTWQQVAGYLVQLGADSAVLLDGGGSTTMVARRPGQGSTTVLNTPSDGAPRPVANGLFVYSNENQPGPATTAAIDGGSRRFTAVLGGPNTLPVYSLDELGNPASGQTRVRIVPSSLGTWSDGVFTPRRAGHGVVMADNGRAHAVVPLVVTNRLRSLEISPAQPDLGNGQSQQFTLTGVADDGARVDVPASAATWSVSDPALGSVDANGSFTAADQGDGLLTVTARAGGASVGASVAVGSTSVVLDHLSDASAWSYHTLGGTTATLSAAPGVVPPGGTGSGSLQFGYDFPAGAGVHQLVFYPNKTLTVGENAQGQAPTAVGMWMKGSGGHDGLEFAESYLQVNGQRTTLYRTGISYDGWGLLVAQLPAGTQFPVSLGFLDFLNISPTQEAKGTVDVADFQALYSPRPVVEPTYTAVPDNPRWLKFSESTNEFRDGGSTLLVGDDAHLLAADPGSTSANVLSAIADRLPTLPAAARPDRVQAMGDMPDDGAPADLQFTAQELAKLGVPYRDAVGNHEISQGGVPENKGFSAVFGDTHYSYTDGAADVVVTDSAHGGLLASDAYQVPAQPQYPWLVQQLDAAATPVVVVATHMPAYDPHPVANSEFSDRWEARMYLQLVQTYQQTHPDRHVLMLYGHARGFAEQILDPTGQPTDAEHGIPQLTVADLGMPAYATADQGGFYHFALVHALSDGTVQFSVEPVLSAITVSAPEIVAVGSSTTLTATGTCVSGDNLPPLTMPIADPASHVWSSSDPQVARIDPRSGRLTAVRAGTTTVTVTSGGRSAQATISVH